MIDYHCVHLDVCNYAGFAVQDCAKCKFRRYPGSDFSKTFAAIANKDPRGLVGVWIEHECAEYDGDRLISNYECPYCGGLFKQTSGFCPDCGKPLIIVHRIKSE